jgi:hypothetical protein
MFSACSPHAMGWHFVCLNFLKVGKSFVAKAALVTNIISCRGMDYPGVCPVLVDIIVVESVKYLFFNL